jgi:hypothetical protein
MCIALASQGRNKGELATASQRKAEDKVSKVMSKQAS